MVQQTPGAIGYCELTYALANHIPFVGIQNHDGNWVTASLEGVTAAAAGAAANMPDDFRVSITDARRVRTLIQFRHSPGCWFTRIRPTSRPAPRLSSS